MRTEGHSGGWAGNFVSDGFERENKHQEAIFFDSSLFFFFQAEDGIRDLTVTGVQTCALPISFQAAPVVREAHRMAVSFADYWRRLECSNDDWIRTTEPRHARAVTALLGRIRDRKSVV